VLTPWQLPAARFGYDDVVVVASGASHAAVVNATGQLYMSGRGRMLEDRPGPSGLGYHHSRNTQWVSRLVTPCVLDDPRIGRWHGMHPRFMLAFVMAQHMSLGQNSVSQAFPVGPLQQMLEDMFFVPRAGTSRSILNIMGLIAQQFR